jgi:hypothetical protein
MWLFRRAHGVHSDAHTAVCAVLETHRDVDVRGHFTVCLRFRGSSTDDTAAQHILEERNSERTEELGDDGEAQLGDLEHQFTREIKSFGHIGRVVHVWVVDVTFPADGGARLFDINTHNQEEFASISGLGGGEALCIFESGNGVVNTARADHYDEFVVDGGTLKQPLDLLASTVDGFAGFVILEALARGEEGGGERISRTRLRASLKVDGANWIGLKDIVSRENSKEI